MIVSMYRCGGWGPVERIEMTTVKLVRTSHEGHELRIAYLTFKAPSFFPYGL